MSYFCYQHIRKDTNEVFYIGMGKTADYRKSELGKYRRAYTRQKRNPLWKNIIDKIEYIVEIIFKSESLEEVFAKEVELIKYYGRRDLKLGTLTNMTDGGEGTFNKSADARKRISDSKLGDKNPAKRPEVRKKIGLAGIGRTGSNLGKKFSDEVRKNMSIGQTGKIGHRKGKTHTKEAKRKNSEAHKGKISSRRKIVLQFDLNNNFIKEFICMKDAANEVKVAVSNITSAIKGGSKTSGGYKWKYKEIE